jgi:hypothetical protein
MQQPAHALIALPDYANWLSTDDVAARLGVSSVVVNAWIVTGIKSETGRVHLRAAKVGGRWKVDPARVVEFVAATTAAALPASATPAAPDAVPPAKAVTASARNRRAEECMARLRERGVTAT